MIAWLDASREDQRRMREIVNLFTQSESRDELGVGQVRDAFSDSLFPGTSTLHTRARYATRHFQSLAEAAGLPAIRLHDLRHTNASLALLAGVDMKVVSERLGHSQMSVTADLYTHVNRGLGRDAADRIAAVLGSPSETVPSASLARTLGGWC